MNNIKYFFKLMLEFFQFARKKKAYWLIPLLLLLMPAALLIVTGESATPLIYTLF